LSYFFIAASEKGGPGNMNQNGRVLFIIHDLYQEDNHFPLGIGYLAAVLKKSGVHIDVYCQDVFHYSNEELSAFLRNSSYDLICIGFLAARFKETVLDLCQHINISKKNAWLVLGGHGPTPIPEYVLRKTNSDIIVLGEGEETLPELLKCKLENGDLSKIKGIAYREKAVIGVNERRKPIRDLDAIPFPEWSIFPMEKYTNCLKLFRAHDKDKSLGLLTSRGCINRCNFCYRMEKGIRFRSIKNVVEEIAILNDKYGVNYFFMNDELFVYPKKRVFEFKDELEENDLNIKFSCNARVDVFDEEVALCLKEAGCQFLNFGMESSDQKVLDLMDKRTSVEENIHAAEIANRVGIGLGLNFIWGNLGDTAESLKGNATLIKKFNTYDYIRTIRPVTPYPGCDLYDIAIKKGLLSGPDDFFEKFNNSDLLTVNFTQIPDDKFYQILFEVNKDLILDHFSHTNKDWNAANKLIESFSDLYFKGITTFRGARHYNKKK
jgi:anaerobic magnesium-protoporphyrin IX monomethyl ester cyclase